MAPVTLYLSYTRLYPVVNKKGPQVSLNAVLSTASMGLVCLFLAKTQRRLDLFYVYTLSVAIHLALIMLVRLKFNFPQMSPLRLFGACIGKSWLLVILPLALIQGPSLLILIQLAAAVPILALAVFAFFRLQPAIADYPIDPQRWIRQGIISACSACLGQITIYWQ